MCFLSESQRVVAVPRGKHRSGCLEIDVEARSSDSDQFSLREFSLQVRKEGQNWLIRAAQ